ncbi:transposase [Sphingobacterium paludis]|uniref:Uncharacterized protein n=1 Tax=Sphingobacterium paludis TaxID=1476465 RepID=A0A4R7DBI6_9SPHI|nr:transposase [Sphingobacterium paludis]TDS17254.1 hypothetical protein B0I21_101116 [Sphingobacterium paludis]
MKNLVLSTTAIGLLLTASCQNMKEEKNDPKIISQKAIEVHDEIMPEISNFDRQGIVVDSLLTNFNAVKADHQGLDTAASRQALTKLKGDLESATDKMMEWMKEYNPDSSDVAYQHAEVERISTLKGEFETVNKSAQKTLAPFKK